MARRRRTATSLAERLRNVELDQWESQGQIVRRIGIEVSWAKIANVMISGESVESSNFVAGSAGWQIDGDGNAEFNTIIVRGDIVSSNWDGTEPIDLSSGEDTGATVGFALDSSEGAAQFEGSLWIGGNIELISGGEIRTAADGEDRVVIGFQFYESSNLGFEWWEGTGDTRFATVFGDPTIETLNLEADNNVIVTTGAEFLVNSVDAIFKWRNSTASLDVVVYDHNAGSPFFEVRGDVVPKVDDGYSLGTTALGWKSLYLAPAEAIFFDGAADSFISADAGTMTIRHGRSGSNPGDMFFQVDDTGGTARTRMNIQGDGNIIFFTDSGGSLVTFDGDSDTDETRIYGKETNDWIALDGVAEEFRFYSNTTLILRYGAAVRMQTVYDPTPAGTANVVVESDGRLHRSSSALRRKKNVKPAEELADILLFPRSFRLRAAEYIDHTKVYFGHIADEVAEVLPQAAIYHPDTGEIEDYDDRAILAVHTAKINRLEAEREDLAELKTEIERLQSRILILEDRAA